MSQQPYRSSGAPGTYLRAVEQSTPVVTDERDVEQTQERLPVDPRQLKERKTKSRRPTLAERLPAGVYEQRPRYKRYVLHWAYFWVYASLRLYKIKAPVPRPAVRELIKRNFALLLEFAKTRQPIIAVVNSKGGAGKTVVSTWLAVLIKLATDRVVYIVDANENKGGTASRLGIRRENTVQLRTFLRFEKELSRADQINDALAAHEGSGVLCVASEAADKTFFSQSLFETRMKTLKRAGHTLVLDAGNGIPHAANRGSVAVADVIVTPATTKQEDSFEDAKDTRLKYASDEVNYRFGRKVEEGIIPLLGVSEAQRLHYIEEYGWNPDKVFRIPEDPFMVRKHIVTWSRIRPKTKLALTNVAVAIFQAAPVREPWNIQTDNTQHTDELGLNEVQYVAQPTPYNS